MIYPVSIEEAGFFLPNFKNVKFAKLMYPF